MGEATRHIGHVLTKTNDLSFELNKTDHFDVRENFLFQILDSRKSRKQKSWSILCKTKPKINRCQANKQI